MTLAKNDKTAATEIVPTAFAQTSPVVTASLTADAGTIEAVARYAIEDAFDAQIKVAAAAVKAATAARDAAQAAWDAVANSIDDPVAAAVRAGALKAGDAARRALAAALKGSGFTFAKPTVVDTDVRVVAETDVTRRVMFKVDVVSARDDARSYRYASRLRADASVVVCEDVPFAPSQVAIRDALAAAGSELERVEADFRILVQEKADVLTRHKREVARRMATIASRDVPGFGAVADEVYSGDYVARVLGGVKLFDASVLAVAGTMPRAAVAALPTGDDK